MCWKKRLIDWPKLSGKRSVWLCTLALVLARSVNSKTLSLIYINEPILILLHLFCFAGGFYSRLQVGIGFSEALSVELQLALTIFPCR